MTILEVALLYATLSKYSITEHFLSQSGGTFLSFIVLTGVGLSIGYPTGKNESVPGLVVIATSAGGPANRAGISSGDVILPAQRRWVYMMQQNCYSEFSSGPEVQSVYSS
ncbi:hypothetical protein CQW23_01362 [Capsicum baccatum]|uniref:PDZ domain-containing protein n=1 Tax=Capsicum baccatum TaxID=33114 RepID=A0A2G2XNG7_CAPBA|nr:hypothetical protein CQW23_01362 [Capsicum baccatum]